MTFVTAIMAFIYVCINILKLKDKEILKRLGINIACILCIAAFFWIPMLETYSFAEYDVYQKDAMATKESFYESGLDVKALVFTESNATYVFEIGIPILIMFFLSIFSIKKVIKSKYKKEYIMFLVLGVLCAVITIKQFPWGPFEKIFQMLQFKWRMLLLSNFFLAIVCGINVGVLIKNFNLKDVLVISVISLLYIMILVPYIPKNETIEEIDKYTIGEVTKNKREVITGMGRGEYLPVNTNNHRDYITTRENTIYILKGMREC